MEATSMNESNQDMSIQLDEKKLRRMLNKIYSLERQNSKTGKYNDKKMKEKIQEIIEEEAKKCF